MMQFMMERVDSPERAEVIPDRMSRLATKCAKRGCECEITLSGKWGDHRVVMPEGASLTGDDVEHASLSPEGIQIDVRVRRAADGVDSPS